MTPPLLRIPTELRVKIFRHFFIDLIDELSDNLFAVFQIYDHMYDYTASYLESHVGRTGLTPILYTCKQIHGEALGVLCELSEFVVNLVGDSDSDDQERASVRFSQGTRHLEFVKNLKVNFMPKDDASNENYLHRLDRFLHAIHHGESLRSLNILIGMQQPDWGSTVSPWSFDRILDKLETLKTQGRSISVYLGQVTHEQISDERFTLLLDVIDGHNMGRGHPDLGPSYYDGGDESDSESFDYEDEGDEFQDKDYPPPYTSN